MYTLWCLFLFSLRGSSLFSLSRRGVPTLSLSLYLFTISFWLFGLLLLLRLQDEVVETIADVKAAGVKVWVLTGDKVETAISIAHSCSLLTDSTYNAVVDGKSQAAVREQLHQYMNYVVAAQLAADAFEAISFRSVRTSFNFSSFPSFLSSDCSCLCYCCRCCFCLLSLCCWSSWLAVAAPAIILLLLSGVVLSVFAFSDFFFASHCFPSYSFFACLALSSYLYLPLSSFVSLFV